MVIVAVVGLPGAGKTAVTAMFTDAGFANVYLGQPVFDELDVHGLPYTQEYERPVRERLREEHGMGAMAKLTLPRIEELAGKGDLTLESLYSWEEYLLVKERFGELFRVVAVLAPPRVRYARMARRPKRPLTAKQCAARDRAQIEQLHQGGPIAIADHFIVNDGTLEQLQERTRDVIEALTAH